MAAGYNEILKFIKNIFMANGKSITNEEFMQLWVREIRATEPNIADLINAETKVIREEVPLKISEVCKAIYGVKATVALPEKQKIYCKYCGGKGIVFGIKFDEQKRYNNGADYILNCVCGNSRNLQLATMDENDQNNKTLCKDGYFLIFPTVTEKFAYLDKVEANGGRDIN